MFQVPLTAKLLEKLICNLRNQCRKRYCIHAELLRNEVSNEMDFKGQSLEFNFDLSGGSYY